ncbi:hypothetical protein BGZ98_000996, partial [Dissophora globulifera]
MSEMSFPATPLASLQTVDQARAELEARLMAIHNDLQLTQSIGLLFVKRQEDLQNCFEQLQELNNLDNATSNNKNHRQTLSDGSDSGSGSEATTLLALPEPLREQLALIDKEFQEGQNGIMDLKGLIDAQLPSIEVQPLQNDDVLRSGPGVLGPSALPSSTLPTQSISKPRRHKVVVPSTPLMNDPAFPVQIQDELLNQVRYWTSQAEMKEKLNQEYDTKITEMERIIEALNKQRRMQRQKEDQWNLELTNQELRGQNAELQSQLSRAVHDQSKLQKAFTAASEQLEQLKDKEERTAGQLELAKTRHEQEMSTMRKNTAGIQRDKSDLMKKMDDLNATLIQQQQKLAKKATMEALALAQEKEDRELDTPVEPPILIQAPPRLQSTEDLPLPPVANSALNETRIASLARETSFAHQQSIISELQSKLSQEITEKEQLLALKEELLTEKEELVKMLADREETIETLRMEDTMGGFTLQAPEQVEFALTSHESDSLVLESSSPDEEISRRPLSFRAASPIPSGGLFAELAQAKFVEEPVKVVVECKDQEVMTEPIESWIHTIPGLFPVPVPVAAAPEKVETETSTAFTNTETKSVSDGATSTDDLPAPELEIKEEQKVEAKVMVDDSTSTDDLLPAAAVTQPENEEVKAIAVGTTLPEAKILVDGATSTDNKTFTDSTTLTDSKTVADSATLTDDLPAPAVAIPAVATVAAVASQLGSKSSTSASQRNGHLADIITEKSSMDTKSMSTQDSVNVATPTVMELDVAAVRLPDVLDHIEAITATKASQPEFVEPHLDEAVRVSKNLELDITQPVPRVLASDIPLDDERRHTCDMSQAIIESSTDDAPPVPAVPRDYMNSRPGTVVSTADSQEFRVSFGSAFGYENGSSMMTGSIQPVYDAAAATAAVEARIRTEGGQQQDVIERDNDEQKERGRAPRLLSPGRPTTGPPSTLLARAAARASMASEMDGEAFSEPYLSSHNHQNGIHTAGAESQSARHPLDGSHPPSPTVAFPPKAASAHSSSVRSPSAHSSSVRSEKYMAGASPPPSSQYTRPAVATGAALISGTTRTAYTFGNSSSQVHVPQAQHITDSSGASIGRPRYHPSPNGSVSSMSTDYGGPHRDRRLSVSSNYDGTVTATDPTMIQIITQTMIGDYLWKYTRRPMASVISDKKHRRYFWVHPYTKTIYWSLNNPAADGSREQRAKS